MIDQEWQHGNSPLLAVSGSPPDSQVSKARNSVSAKARARQRGLQRCTRLISDSANFTVGGGPWPFAQHWRTTVLHIDQPGDSKVECCTTHALSTRGRQLGAHQRLAGQQLSTRPPLLPSSNGFPVHTSLYATPVCRAVTCMGPMHWFVLFCYVMFCSALGSQAAMARSSDERWTAGAILVCLYAIFIVWFCGFPMAPTPITEVDAEVGLPTCRRV